MTEKNHWYAVYTRSRAEKKVLVELEKKKIESYLPLQKKLRQWSDRKKWIETPLIPGYLFVNIGSKNYDEVLKTNGIVAYVRFEGRAAIIPDYQIEFIRKMLNDPTIDIEVLHHLPEKGDKINITSGPLIGLHGTLLSYKGKNRVSVELSQLNLSLIVEVQISEINILEEL